MSETVGNQFGFCCAIRGVADAMFNEFCAMSESWFLPVFGFG